MRAKLSLAIVAPALIMAGAARSDDVRAAMEAVNAQFVAAFNTPDTAAFPDQYTADAVLLFQSAPPVTGPEAIRQFWEARIKLGGRNVKFEIIDTGADGRYAYQVTKTTAQLVRDTGEKIPVSGHTVRIFERQPDGSWKTKVQMFNRPSAP
jgi:ketosteroid isomerase-like protein